MATTQQRPAINANKSSVPNIMATPPTPTTQRARRESRDTGFPEPFNGDRNTTLPHPDADTSPNASISQDELSVDAAMKRRHRSFLKKHRRTVSNASHFSSQQVHPILASLSLVDTSLTNRSEEGKPASERTNSSPSTESDARNSHEMEEPGSPSENHRKSWLGNKLGRRK